MVSGFRLEELRNAVHGRSAAFRCVTEYQPVGGSGSKVFPPTYAGSVYAFEHRRLNSEEHQCVILDSVASQANRMEETLLRAWHDGRLSLPVISVDFSDEFPDLGKVTSLDAPHRIADSILRYAQTKDGNEFFKESKWADLWKDATIHNATSLFEICPTALIFGTWGSPASTGGLGAKFQRIIVSEMVGIDAVPGTKTMSRIDPTGAWQSVELLQARDDSPDLDWTLDTEHAAKSGSNFVKFAQKNKRKAGKPSAANLGNVLPVSERAAVTKDPDSGSEGISGGGVTISRALQTTTISLPAVRRLRFPVDGAHNRERDAAAQTALVALALVGAVLAREEGADLRSRCHLVTDSEFEWKLIGKPGEKAEPFILESESVLEMFHEALAAAREAGLPWHEEEIELVPSPQLVAAIQKSREKAEEEDVG